MRRWGQREGVRNLPLQIIPVLAALPVGLADGGPGCLRFQVDSSFAEHNTVLAGKIVLFYSDKPSMLWDMVTDESSRSLLGASAPTPAVAKGPGLWPLMDLPAAIVRPQPRIWGCDRDWMFVLGNPNPSVMASEGMAFERWLGREGGGFMNETVLV